MLKLILAAFLLIQAAQIEASGSCGKGPSYWCQSIKTANACQAFNHCMQTVWTKHQQYFEQLPAEHGIGLNNPDSCQNCQQCVKSGFTRCPAISDFETEISELSQNKLSSGQICVLLGQCGVKKEMISPLEETHLDNTAHQSINAHFACGLHPRNWCDNLETARKCNCLDQCIDQWSVNKYQLKADLTTKDLESILAMKTCEFCLYSFEKLTSALQDTENKLDTKEYLSKSCSLLPSKRDVDECLIALDQNISEIKAMLSKKVHSSAICKALRSCDASYLETEVMKKPSWWSQVKINIVDGDQAIIKTPWTVKKPTCTKKLVKELQSLGGIACETCTIVFNAAKYMLQNKNADEKVLKYISIELCPRLGDYNATCYQYIETEGVQLLKLVADSVNPAVICHGMGLCTKLQVNQEPNAVQFYDLKMRSPLNCTVCKDIIEKVKVYLSDGKSQAMIVNYIDTELCSKVGQSSELCKTLVATYGPIFLNTIANDVKPEQICDMIGMCPKTQTTYTNHLAHVTLEEKQEHQAVALKTTADPTVCILCEFAMDKLKHYLSNNATEAQIEHELELLCAKLPKSIVRECNTLVIFYGPLIIKSIIEGHTPMEVCEDIQLCKKALGPNKIPMMNMKPAQEIMKPETKSEVSCVVCQFVINIIDHRIDTDTTERTIKFTVDNVCKIVPHRYRAHCDQLMAKYGVELVDFLVKSTDPVKACEFVGVCQLKDAPSMIVSNGQDNSIVEMTKLQPAKIVDAQIPIVDMSGKSQEEKTLECSLCIYAAEVVTKALEDKKNDEKIMTELLLLCNLFPKNYKEQCIGFMNEYGPYVIQMIAADMKPEEACKSMKMCDAKSMGTSERYNLA